MLHPCFNLEKLRCCLGFASLILGLFVPARAWGWVGTGHKVIAMIVWDELTPTARGKAIEILKRHPRYEKDLLAELSPGSDEASAERHAFANAATWPDTVRSQSHPMHFAANHPQWHYIDLPYHPENGAEAAKPAQSPTADAAREGPRDIVEALAKNAEDLRNPAASDEQKAVALCWILHLGGDIHQPLHAIEMYSQQFPEGDKGGNALLVLRDPPYPNSQMNLHLLWDQLPGNYASEQPIGYLAGGLRTDPQFSRQQLKDQLSVKDFGAWARESHDLAVKYVYLDGTLKAATAGRGGQAETLTQVPGVPPGYVRQAERIALRQAALAGYRTADLLNGLLDPKPPTK
jgi:hypothetical protein